MNMMTSMDGAALAAALSLFTKVSGIMIGMITLVFTVRISLMVLGIASSYEYAELFKSTASFLGLTILFPKLVAIIFSLVGGLAAKISFIPTNASQEKINGFFTTVFESNTMAWLIGKIGYIAVDALAVSFYTVSISLLLSIAPVVFFLNLLAGVSHGTRAYFGVLISLALWPVLWNLIGKLGSELANGVSESPIRTVSFWAVIQILQFFSPLFAVALFQNLASSSAVPKIISLGRSI